MSDRRVVLCSQTIKNDEEDDDSFIAALQRKNHANPKPTSFGRNNHRSILDSSESEDEYAQLYGHNKPLSRQPRNMSIPNINNDEEDDDSVIAAFLRKNRANPKPTSFGHNNHRSILNSSESEDEYAQLYGHNKHLSRQPRNSSTNDISSLLRMMMLNLNQLGGAGAGAGAGASRSKLIINRNRRTIPDNSDSCSDDEGLTQHYFGKIKHFSHPHNLSKYNFQQDSETNCKVCDLQLVGSGFGCQSCQFYLHASCFDLPQKIQHDSHHAHPLTLRYPSYYKHCGKTCDACCEPIRRSFLYCCDLCHFDLHVTCATLYNLVNRPGTSNGKLRLQYTFPFGDCNSNIIPRCNVCNKKMSKEGWLYYSKDTGYIAHINCAKGNLTPSWIKEKLNMLKIN